MKISFNRTDFQHEQVRSHFCQPASVKEVGNCQSQTENGAPKALDSARLHLRAMALLWNFHPYGSRTRANNPNRSSPFEDLNGCRYHENWLRNLLIAGSMNGY